MVRRHPEHVAQPGVEEGGALFVVRLVEPETGELDGGVQPRLARAQRLFAALALGDVDAESRQAFGFAAGRAVGATARSDPAHAALARVTDPVLDADGLAGAPGSIDGFPNARQSSGRTDAS